MTSHTKKSRGVLLTVLAVAGAVGYVAGVFLPGQKALSNHRKTLREKQDFIARTDLAMNTSVVLEESWKQAKHAVEAWRSRTHRDRGTSPLLGEISRVAEECNVTLHRLTPREAFEGDVLREQPLDLELSGTFAAIMRFLQEIEGRPESIWVPKCKFTSGKDGKVVQCALSLVVFVDNRGNSG